MIGCRRTWSRTILAIGIALIAPSIALAAARESLPRDASTIGIMPFRGSEEQGRTGSELLRELLEAYGFKVKALVDLENPRQAFASDPDLDFVIRGLIGGDMASALVYPRSAESVRRLESTAEKPVRDLAAKVLRHVSSQSSIESIVAMRKERASAKLKEDPRDFDSLVLMGLAMRHEGSIPEAIRYFEQAIEVNSNDPDAHYSLALSLEHSGKPQSAMSHLQSALRLDPHHEAASIALANTYLELGQVNDAIAVYRQMLQSPLNASLANWNLAVAYMRIGDSESALRHLQGIEPSDPHYARAQSAIFDLESERQSRREKRLGGCRGCGRRLGDCRGDGSHSV